MRILIVGNLGGQVSNASVIAAKNGARVSHVLDLDSAINFIRDGKGADLAMVDVKLDIGFFIGALKSERITIPVVACGLDNDSASAVKAIKAGAKEYVPLPPDEDMIAAVIEAISHDSNDVIGTSPTMRSIINMCNQIAPSEASVLITGESGTGKEVIAKYIHSKSKRAKNSMISVNCAAIPANLMESELFGHEKGAFTGAVARRIGKFEEASDSTLLLDEISEMDISLQAKLLRAIQEKEIDRVGGNKPVKVNIRLLATSNRDLLKEIKEGRFREDLYFRLNVINLALPPLRERKDDIEVFARHFINKYSEMNDIVKRDISANALAKLISYRWPGNVRELENTIHRAVVVASGQKIEEHDIILTGQPGNDNESSSNIGNLVGRTVSAVEKELILGTLNHCLGNRTQAAGILGISIRTLRNKLNEYKIVNN